MAQVVLSQVGARLGGPIGAVIGNTVGRTIDNRLIAGLEPPRQRGPRLDGLRIQGTAEGAPMAFVLGRARVTGQVIWAARFREAADVARAGKGGPRTVTYGYSLSFAVALCEGEIDGIGRVWADGREMDVSGVTMRVHRGGADQAADPLIEAVEGDAPAYRGVAYVVFEDLPLAPYGNRPPQLSFEVFRRPRGDAPGLEDRIEGVCLIPGAGEFTLATEAVSRREGLTRSESENVHAGAGRTDLVVSLDQLQAQCPNLKRVSLVIGWFGDDVRAAHCQVSPGVESLDKRTEPAAWSVAGLARSEARLISGGPESPAYGGTPSDESVRQAVAELKSRGLEVTLYPFVFMDCEGYPWRGRVSGRDGASAEADVAAVFGAADGWGLRRMARHYAALAAETGADGLLIGSEMRGLTWTRDAAGGFPAVAQLKALAAECRAIVGADVKISYAADWSEYSGFQRDGERLFHLDPLWADANVDYVGIDWYPPLGDWREGGGGVDAEAFGGPDDAAYLASQVAGGEGFDWFYASEADRAAQVRTPIVDGAHGEDWVFRPKDLAGWWSNAHHDRPGGVRSGTPTAWVAGMKPIRLTEFGCAAVDRGGNAPNLFQDPKSSESALPPFSTGARDDRMQRRALEAVLSHFAAAGNNPVSAAYGGPMLEAADAWCWDARPWPAFPGRAEVWADASAWRCGHWLNGRLSGETRDLIAELLRRAGLGADEFEVGGVEDEIQGYVIDGPMRVRDAVAPLIGALGLTAAERGGKISVLGAQASVAVISAEALAQPEDGVSVVADRALEAAPGSARVRFIDGYQDYQTGAVVVRSDGEGGEAVLDLPAVCAEPVARAAAERVLEGSADRLTVRLGPLEALHLEAGDAVTLEPHEAEWRIERIDLDEAPSAVLARVSAVRSGEDSGAPGRGSPVDVLGAPFLRVIDLPPLPGAEADGRPLAVVAAEPWSPMRVWAGADSGALTSRGVAVRSATVGLLQQPLEAGVVGRWDEANTIVVRFEGREVESRTETAVLAGANVLAAEAADGWELIQFQHAELRDDGAWVLSRLLRGQQGSEAAMKSGADAGTLAVLIDGAPVRVESGAAERGLPLVWRAGPDGGPAGGPLVREIVYAPTGVQARPWAPAHLGVEATAAGGRRLTWIPRTRIGGDGWDVEPAASDASRYRIRILNGDVEVRVLEAIETTADYPAADVAADWPGGLEGAEVAVSQWGEGYGWGAEARAPLI